MLEKKRKILINSPAIIANRGVERCRQARSGTVDASPRQVGYASAMEGISTILADAVAHHQAGRFSEAVSDYQKLVAAGIRVLVLFQSLGAALLALERPDDAIKALTEATRLDKNSAPTHANLGHSYAMTSRWREAADE